MAAGNDAGGLARRDLLLGLGIGMGALALPMATAKPARAQDADIEVIIFGSSDDDKGSLGTPSDLRLQAKSWALDAAMTLGYGGAIMILFGGVTMMLGGPVSAGVFIAGGVLSAMGLMMEWALWQFAWDPPQLDYRIPVRVKPWTISVPDLHRGALPAAEKAIRAANIGVPAVYGMIDSLERIQGAEIAGDTAWVDRHRVGLDLGVAIYSARAQQMARSLVGVANSEFGKLRVSPSRTAQAQAIFADPARSAPIRQLLASAGLTTEQVDHVFQKAAEIDPTKVRTQTLKSVILDTAKALNTSADRAVATW